MTVGELAIMLEKFPDDATVDVVMNVDLYEGNYGSILSFEYDPKQNDLSIHIQEPE